MVEKDAKKRSQAAKAAHILNSDAFGRAQGWDLGLVRPRPGAALALLLFADAGGGHEASE